MGKKAFKAFFCFQAGGENFKLMEFFLSDSPGGAKSAENFKFF